eukprot:1157217-Pelagomonas_calceolata.AAC.9
MSVFLSCGSLGRNSLERSVVSARCSCLALHLVRSMAAFAPCPALSKRHVTNCCSPLSSRHLIALHCT